MKNFKYAVGDEVYILSGKEHEQLCELIKEGKSGATVLRDGKLIINLAFIRSVNETDQPTEIEEEKKLALPFAGEDLQREVRSGAQKVLAMTHNDFYAKMKWEHRPNCNGKTCSPTN